MTEHPKLASFASRLSEPAELERRFRILSVIETIYSAKYPRYLYTRSFGPQQQRFGMFDNGGGDLIGAFFADDGTFVRAFDHEDPMSPYVQDELWPGLLDGLPEQFTPFTSVAQLGDEGDYPAITLALWNLGQGWQPGNPGADEDGSEPEPTTWMFDLLTSAFTAADLAADLAGYFGKEIDPQPLKPFLDEQPLTRDRVIGLVAEPDWDAVAETAKRAGYPAEL